MLLALELALSSCGVRPPAPGLEPGEVGRYERITFVPLLAEEARLEWNDSIRMEAGSPEAVDWDIRQKAGQIANELLARGGTEVTTLEDVAELLPDDSEETEWAVHVWERLVEDDRLQQSNVVVVLRQNAVDALGRQYNPVADFLSFGILGVVAGAVRREERFHPSFLLALNIGLHATMMGPSRCSIGFDARLLDAETGETLGATDAVLGQEHVPPELQKETWPAMSEHEKDVAETYCIAALRRGVAQALHELEATTAVE